MDDLKHKLFSFVKKQSQGGSRGGGPTSPTNVYSASHATAFTSDLDLLPVTRGREYCSKKLPESDPLADQDVLESIESVYFSNEDFDPCHHELKRLPEAINCSSIEKDCEKLNLQLSVVSNKVLQLILQKQSSCSEEFAKILELQEELHNTLEVCKAGRTHLNHGKRQFTTASLGILANYKKRQLVQGLLHSLNTIKTLQRTEERLQELLHEGNYPEAIGLLLECQSASVTYRHFACVAALSGKLQDTLDMAEEQLDQSLAKVCSNFNAEHYSKVQAGYRLLGKTQMAMDQLHMHFASAIHNTVFNVVHGYVELCSKSNDSETQQAVHKKQFKVLCQCVTAESFIPCLIDLCKALWEIMKSYHQVIRWHAKSDLEKIPTEGVQPELVDFEASFNKQYVKQKLENGLFRIWHDVQARVSVYLLASDLAWYKFEEILQVLGVVHRLIEVGEEFCGSKSEELQNSIRQQSGNYFKNYHQGRLDELRIFLENDGWEICPVKPSFSLLQLQEFKSLRHILKSWKPKNNVVSSPDYSSSNHSQDGSSVAGGFFARYSETGNPFEILVDDTQDEDILANISDEPSGYFSDDSDEDISEELKKDFVDENVGETISKPAKLCIKKDRRELKTPIVTNTTLTVLRQCGKYLQMSRLLRPIAGEVMAGMIQLFEFYLYAVHSFFTADLNSINILPSKSDFSFILSFRSRPGFVQQLSVPTHSLYNLKLQATLKRIEDTLILPQLDVRDSDVVQSKVKDRIAKPLISPVVDLALREKLHGLAERVVAVESTIFLAKQFEILQGYLEHIIPGQNKHILQQFYMQTVDVASELRRPVYMCVSSRAVDLRMTLTLMGKVNWEVKEVMSQHSQYVDVLLRELQIFTMRFEETASKIPIPREVYSTLWENLLRLTSNTFVEGFSNARKCSNGGRALMQLDFTQFLSKLEKLTSLRPIPYREHVETYIKAYYLPENGFEGWIREHNEYSCKQLLALVSCACQNNKKTRQRLVTLIEEMEKFGR